MASTRCAKEELLPKTLRLDESIFADACETWRQYRIIAADHALFDRGRRMYKTQFFGESGASDYYLDRVVGPASETINALLDCMDAWGAEDPPNVDPRLLRALRGAHEVTPRSQGPRCLVEATAPALLADRARSLDLSEAARILPAASGLHDLNRRLADRPHDQPRDTNVYNVADTEAIETAKQYFSRSVPDLAVYYIGKNSDQNAIDGGVPILVAEMKDPYRFSLEAIMRSLQHFNLHVYDDELRLKFLQEGIITVREAINRGLVNGETAAFLRSLSHLIRHMFFHRLTFGIWSTAIVTIALKLDWTHATHPGQHASYALIANGAPDLYWPPWPENANGSRGDPFHVVNGLAGAQMTVGQVDQALFERALLQMVEDHVEYQPAQGGTDGDTDGEADRPLDGLVRMTRSRTRAFDEAPGHRGPVTHGYTTYDSTHTSQSGFDVNQEMLNRIDSPALRAEIQRFLDLDERIHVLKIKKTETLKMLCAAFPLDPDAAFKNSNNTLPLHQLVELAQAPRPAELCFSDPSLFTWGTISDGMLPLGFARRLQAIDEREKAATKERTGQPPTTAIQPSLGVAPGVRISSGGSRSARQLAVDAGLASPSLPALEDTGSRSTSSSFSLSSGATLDDDSDETRMVGGEVNKTHAFLAVDRRSD